MMDVIALLEKLGSDATLLQPEKLEQLLLKSELSDEQIYCIKTRDLTGLRTELNIENTVICCAQAVPDEEEPNEDEQPQKDDAVNG
ncbi:hypothetical protein KDN34_03850 [Shewanella yunxiaonensis]|uniref:Uncharacterized protein n=1 Tax=Shewanella yunxiaonensis TaxID=2829809 RepID=A0ABX7YV58_9GAMM|nr:MULTISPECIES: hypothetical protein [Shewanella]MDF0533263.1 hypothetical protein [Shewanella sp. A32]QUN06597.1 hypothetical protein KDN34_03850 [Shewanella yunxiaonensis]